MSIRIEAEIKVSALELDGGSAPLGTRMTVRSHSTKDSLVVVEIGGKAVTVVGSDLRAAIQRCERY